MGREKSCSCRAPLPTSCKAMYPIRALRELAAGLAERDREAAAEAARAALDREAAAAREREAREREAWERENLDSLQAMAAWAAASEGKSEEPEGREESKYEPARRDAC